MVEVNAAQNEVLTERMDSVVILTMNRPSVRNALNPPLMRALSRELSAAAVSEDVRAAVITGGTNFFSAGADISAMSSLTTSSAILTDMSSLWDEVGRFPKPLIAAVSGYAYGGGLELAMACDMIVSSEDAKFGQPEINLGIIPGAGGTQRLPRLVGKNIALEMILTGKPIGASQALAAGLINRIVPRELVLEEAVSLAREIASKAPIAVKLAKEAVNTGLNLDLASGLLLEHRLFYMLFGTSDQKEGMRAFLEKRSPAFRGE